MTEEEDKIEKGAMEFARVNKVAITKRRADPKIYLPERDPVSVFMAGSPGAGKTEASIELLKEMDDGPVIRIDPDELRSEFPTYNGANAWLFQGAVSALVSRIHDLALKQSQSFLLDGTLSNYGVAEHNIERSLKRKREVQILYVYQEPQLAWEFVQAREASEGRRINKETFVNQYFAARVVVNDLKLKFGKSIRIDLLLKNNDNSNRTYHAGVDQIDRFIPEKYSRSDVERLISAR